VIFFGLFAAYVAISLAVGFWLRRLFSWAQRLNDCHWRFYTLGDENLTAPIFGMLYFFGKFPRRPMVGDTISALVWWGERQGIAWCRPVRRAVDALFLLAGQREHCRKAFENWANPLEVSNA